ncbi:MAG: GNAT family N-acetyltransferase [Acidocella sp.]|nr:GNAT family N-acetyltransferase [Acidocella sp.]
MIEATPAYAELLAAMHGAVFTGEADGDPWDAASFAKLLGQKGVSGWIDTRGGFLLVRAVLDEAEILTLGAMTRRQGIGLGLLTHGIAALQARGVVVLHLEVAAENAAARALYAKAGFLPSGIRRGYYADGSDAVMLKAEFGMGGADGA